MYSKAQLFYIIQNNAYRWNDFRRKHQNETLDLSGLDFRDCVVCQLDLYNVDLSGADLSGVALTGTDLSGSNLSGSNLSGANFSGANLTDTAMDKANFTGACFNRTLFAEIDCRRVDFTSAKFYQTNFGVSNFTTCDFSQAQFVDVPYLMSVGFVNCNFTGAYFKTTDFRSVLFHKCQISGTPMEAMQEKWIELDGIHYRLTDPRGYILAVYGNQITAGCREFWSFGQAISHWQGLKYPDTCRGDRYISDLRDLFTALNQQSK